MVKIAYIADDFAYEFSSINGGRSPQKCARENACMRHMERSHLGAYKRAAPNKGCLDSKLICAYK